MTEESVVLCWVLHCYATSRVPPLNGGGNLQTCLQEGSTSREGKYLYIYICIYQKGIKNGSVPGDMLVLSIMTLDADLLRQIATDPHGFSRAHSIGNGLFNFPQGALPFPRYASLEKVSTFGFGQSDENIHRMLYQ